MMKVTTLSLPKVSKCYMVNCVYTETCEDLNCPLAQKKLPFLFGPIKSKVSDSNCYSYTTDVISNNQLIIMLQSSAIDTMAQTSAIVSTYHTMVEF